MGFFGIAHAAEESAISIHLAPDIIGHIWGIPITSILLTVWVSMAVLAVVVFILKARLSAVPGRFQTAAEALVRGAYDYMVGVFENEARARKFFPIIMTFFIFILAMNWISLLPGVDAVGITKVAEDHGVVVSKFVPFLHSAATDLNITIAFAIIAVLVIEIAGIAALGLFKYGSKFINFSSPLKFFIGLLELVSELGRLISFSFRLFGNIFAGKTLLVIAIAFAPFVVPVPILAYELFVGFIQALVFAFLALIFIKLAVEEPH